MPNKTIYVSQADEAIYEEAKEIAGTNLSTVISQALKDFIYKIKQRSNNMKEIKLKMGVHGAQREQKFIGREVGKWQGFSDDKDWWLEANVYKTQKNNWAVYLKTVCKVSLVTNPFTGWMNLADSMAPQNFELFVAEDTATLENKLPKELFKLTRDLETKEENASEFLDI
jgi:EXLDI family protein